MTRADGRATDDTTIIPAIDPEPDAPEPPDDGHDDLEEEFRPTRGGWLGRGVVWVFLAWLTASGLALEAMFPALPTWARYQRSS